MHSLWLVRSFPDEAVRVQVQAGGIGLCSWARHLNLTVPFSSRVYKRVPANLILWVMLRCTSIPSSSCYRNRVKLRSNGNFERIQILLLWPLNRFEKRPNRLITFRLQVWRRWWTRFSVQWRCWVMFSSCSCSFLLSWRSLGCNYSWAISDTNVCTTMIPSASQRGQITQVCW